MNLLYLSTPLNDTYGGGEKFIETLLDSLPKSYDHTFLGHHPSLQKSFEKRKQKTYLANGGNEPVTPANLLKSPISLIQGLFFCQKYKHLIRKSDIIVFALSYSEMIFIAPWIHLHEKKPMVFFIRSNRCPKIYLTPLVFILRFLWNRHPSVFISKSQFEEFSSKGMTGKKSTIIQNAIPVSSFLAKEKGEDATVKLGFISRLHEEKGLETLLEALALLKSKRKIRLEIAGTGPHEDKFKQIAKNIHYTENVEIEWQGFLEKTESKEFYQSQDCIIFPSTRESFGKVLTESWERGTPVISSSIEVFLEIKSFANDQENELIFETGNANDLADRIDYFIKFRKNYQTLSYQKYLHQIVEANFDEKKMVQEYHELFNSLISS